MGTLLRVWESRWQSSADDITKMLCNFQHESRLSVGDLQRIQDWRQMIVKLHVNDGANDGDDTTLRRRFLSGRLRGIIPTCHSHSGVIAKYSEQFSVQFTCLLISTICILLCIFTSTYYVGFCCLSLSLAVCLIAAAIWQRNLIHSAKKKSGMPGNQQRKANVCMFYVPHLEM